MFSWHYALFAPRNKALDEDVEVERTQKMIDAYKELFKVGNNGASDSSYWSKVSLR